MRGAEHYFKVPPSPCMLLNCQWTELCATEMLACQKFYAWVSVNSQNPKRSHWEHKSNEPTTEIYDSLYDDKRK